MEESYLRKRKKLYNISNLSQEEIKQFEKQIQERKSDVFNPILIDTGEFQKMGLEHITMDRILVFPKY